MIPLVQVNSSTRFDHLHYYFVLEFRKIVEVSKLLTGTIPVCDPCPTDLPNSHINNTETKYTVKVTGHSMHHEQLCAIQ